MNRTLHFLLIFLFATPLLIQGQFFCGYDHLTHAKEEAQAGYMGLINESFRYAHENMERGNRDQTIYQIPVVFHVVWNSDAENLADSVIQSQMDVLNEDYRRQNPDSTNTREIFQSIAADVGIEFYLADTDPDGNPSDGINRVYTENDGFDINLFDESSFDFVKQSELGGADAWDTEHYLNIWVCRLNPSLFGQIFGFAYPPEGVPNWPDGVAASSPEYAGVVLHYATIGRNNPNNNDDDFDGNDYGRNAVHEVGHFLGLRHIWGDAVFEDGCSVDDGIEDTPNASASSNYTCDFDNNTCTDPGEEYPDMVENYMDYNPDLCLNMFTQEQADMMRFVLEDFRPGLIEGQFDNVKEVTHHEFNLSVFPNPVSEAMTLSMNSSTELIQIEIFDENGRLILSQRRAAGEISISTQEFSQGVYHLRVSNEQGTQSTSFVKI